jgi:hypothetical protein
MTCLTSERPRQSGRPGRRNMKLFAGIIERGGHFKIYSYGNDL